MRICIGGKNNIAVDVISHILDNYPEISLFVIPNKGDDGKDGSQRSLRKYALDHNIPIVSLLEIYSWEDLIFLSVEFDRIIRPDRFKSKELFNIHFSFLPKYKGCHTAAMPILNGDEVVGVTFHLMDKGIDTGDIIDQEKILVSKDETCRSLYYKFLRLGGVVVKRNLEAVINRTYKAHSQLAVGSSYYPRTAIDYHNLQIDYNRTASQVDRQFRAYSFRDFQLPQYEGTPISYVEITDNKSTERPGTLIAQDEISFTVTTIDYNVILHRDILAELMNLVKLGDFSAIKQIKDIKRYIYEQESTHGWTLLMIAAYYNHYDIAQYLIAKGSDVNAKNYKGTTVIMYAKNGMLETGDDRLFKCLLRKGANPFIEDYSGHNLFYYVNINEIKEKFV